MPAGAALRASAMSNPAAFASPAPGAASLVGVVGRDRQLSEATRRPRPASKIHAPFVEPSTGVCWLIDTLPAFNRLVVVYDSSRER